MERSDRRRWASRGRCALALAAIAAAASCGGAAADCAGVECSVTPAFRLAVFDAATGAPVQGASTSYGACDAGAAHNECAEIAGYDFERGPFETDVRAPGYATAHVRQDAQPDPVCCKGADRNGIYRVVAVRVQLTRSP